MRALAGPLGAASERLLSKTGPGGAQGAGVGLWGVVPGRGAACFFVCRFRAFSGRGGVIARSRRAR